MEDDDHVVHQMQGWEDEEDADSESMLEDECAALMEAVRKEGARLREVEQRVEETMKQSDSSIYNSASRRAGMQHDEDEWLKLRMAGKRPRSERLEEGDENHDNIRMRTKTTISQLDQLKEWLTDAWKGLLS